MAVPGPDHLRPVRRLSPGHQGVAGRARHQRGRGHRAPVPGRRAGDRRAVRPPSRARVASWRAVARRRSALPRDLLDLESARVLDAMPRRGGMGTVRVAQRAGLAPATTADPALASSRPAASSSGATTAGACAVPDQATRPAEAHRLPEARPTAGRSRGNIGEVVPKPPARCTLCPWLQPQEGTTARTPGHAGAGGQARPARGAELGAGRVLPAPRGGACPVAAHRPRLPGRRPVAS